MDPEPAPVPKLPRNVHFPTRPTYIDYEVPMPGPSSSPEQVRHPSPSPVPVPVPSRSRAASVGEVTGRRSQEDSASSAWKEKGKQRAADVLLENGTSPSPAKSNLSESGRDAEADADTSGEIRVRGKEQELSAVRAERRAREKWWETEAETTMIREEKVGYEDKIKKLEEEVMRLQEEVRYYIYICSLLTLPPKVGEEAGDELCRSLVFYAPASAASTSTALTSTPCPSKDTNNPCGRRAFLR